MVVIVSGVLTRLTRPILSTSAQYYNVLRRQSVCRGAHSIDTKKTNHDAAGPGLFYQAEEFNDEEDAHEWEEDDESGTDRFHPLTLAGKFHTSPRAVWLPQLALVDPISSLLADVSNVHLDQAAEGLLGGPGLPYGPAVRTNMKLLPQTSPKLTATQPKMSDMEANIYLAGLMPGVYASLTSVLTEVRRRLGSEWLRKLLIKEGGPSVLDAGAGGAGIVAWREIVKAEWTVMQEEKLVDDDKMAPFGTSTCITGSKALRIRSSLFLENTTFLPRFPDVDKSPATAEGTNEQKRKRYDIILAPHTIWPLTKQFERKEHVEALWSLLNPDGGVLILLEKGLPRGFETIATARQQILDEYISPRLSLGDSPECIAEEKSPGLMKEKGMIIAPCTNHKPCPLYLIPGMSSGRKDYCRFSQRMTRPAYYQRLLGAKSRNHEDIEFSYLAVQRGGKILSQDASPLTHTSNPPGETMMNTSGALESDSHHLKTHMLSVPRIILPPLKRPGHVIIDVCTPSAKIERWTVPRSLGKQEYHDARKSRWGDLWALGSKTQMPRNLKVGNPATTVEVRKKRKTRSEKLARKRDVKKKRTAVGMKPERPVDDRTAETL